MEKNSHDLVWCNGCLLLHLKSSEKCIVGQNFQFLLLGGGPSPVPLGVRKQTSEADTATLNILTFTFYLDLLWMLSVSIKSKFGGWISKRGSRWKSENASLNKYNYYLTVTSTIQSIWLRNCSNIVMKEKKIVLLAIAVVKVLRKGW